MYCHDARWPPPSWHAWGRCNCAATACVCGLAPLHWLVTRGDLRQHGHLLTHRHALWACVGECVLFATLAWCGVACGCLQNILNEQSPKQLYMVSSKQRVHAQGPFLARSLPQSLPPSLTRIQTLALPRIRSEFPPAFPPHSPHPAGARQGVRAAGQLHPAGAHPAHAALRAAAAHG